MGALKQGQRIYLVPDRESLALLPSGADSSTTCGFCNQIYAWHGGMEIMPPCPRCSKWPELKQLHEVACVIEDGVYVDCSFRDGIMTLGFAHVKNGKAKTFSMRSATTKTDEAEGEAIEKAKELYPNETIFCDHALSAARHGAKYIPRRWNRHAHYAARKPIKESNSVAK